MCRRRATPIVEADLELQYATKVVGLGCHGSRQPRGMEDGVATWTHRSRVHYFVGHRLGPVRWIEVAVSCLKDVEALDCSEMSKSYGVAEIWVRHVGGPRTVARLVKGSCYETGLPANSSSSEG